MESFRVGDLWCAGVGSKMKKTQSHSKSCAAPLQVNFSRGKLLGEMSVPPSWLEIILTTTLHLPPTPRIDLGSSHGVLTFG